MKKSNAKSVPVSFDPAGELIEEMANRLIADYHEELINARIAYLYKNKPMTSKGRAVVATAKKVPKDMKALCKKDFLITISYPTWVDLSIDEQEAILDHELTHCFVDSDDETGETSFKILEHDVNEFNSILLRHGFYGDLKYLEATLEEVKKAKSKKILLKKVADD